jgi:hypothetical protein
MSRSTKANNSATAALSSSAHENMPVFWERFGSPRLVRGGDCVQRGVRKELGVPWIQQGVSRWLP